MEKITVIYPKVKFLATINEEHRHYMGDIVLPDEFDYEKEFEMEWNYFSLPSKGDIINFDQFFKDKDDDVSKVWYDRSFDFHFIAWNWDAKFKTYIPTVWVNGGDK